MKAYYDRRAAEYDDWYLGRGRWAELERDGWDEELAALADTIASLPPRRTLDVACGTGFLPRHLAGAVVGLASSERMLEVARGRAPRGRFLVGDALHLPFDAGAFDRVFTGHFYGHLEAHARGRFLVEARRVAGELVVVDASRAHSAGAEQWERRVLDDGSRWSVFKRYFTGAELARELAGGEVLHEGRWFVVVRAPLTRAPRVVATDAPET